MLDSDFVVNLSKRNTDISEHIQFLYLLPFAIGAKTIVECGCGQSTYALTAVANLLEADLYSIDLTDISRFRGFPEGEELLKGETRHQMMVGDDLDIVLAWDKEIDFLFIDTNHLYHQTLLELRRWDKWVRKGGLIAMHDTGKNNATFNNECRRAMLDFISANKDYQILEFHNQNGFAILRKM